MNTEAERLRLLELGARLKEARIRAGWATARAAAAQCGIREDAYGRIERGLRDPFFSTVATMVEKLGLDPLPLFAPMPAVRARSRARAGAR